MIDFKKFCLRDIEFIIAACCSFISLILILVMIKDKTVKIMPEADNTKALDVIALKDIPAELLMPQTACQGLALEETVNIEEGAMYDAFTFVKENPNGCRIEIKNATDANLTTPGDYKIRLSVSSIIGVADNVDVSLTITKKTNNESTKNETPKQAKTNENDSSKTTKSNDDKSSVKPSGTVTRSTAQQETTTEPQKTGGSVSTTDVLDLAEIEKQPTPGPDAKHVQFTSKTYVGTTVKYGTVVTTTTIVRYDEYSDGGLKEISRRTTTNYDSSNYKASITELTPEANASVQKHSSWINEELKYINEARAAAGVAPVSLDSRLNTAASIRTVEMAWSGVYQHVRPDGTKWSILDPRAHAENIAAGQRTPKEVAEDWNESDGHHHNITNPNYTIVGIGIYYFYGKYYWCELFGY